MKKVKLDPDIIEYDGKGFKKVVKNEDDFWNRLKDIQNEIDTDIFNKHKCEDCGEEKSDVKSRGDGEYLLCDDCLNDLPNETGYCSISCRISGNCDGVVKMSKSEIDKIKAVLSEINEARNKATKNEWETQGDTYIFAKDIMVADNNDDLAIARARGVGGGMSIEQQRDNIKFIALAANKITSLTKALEIAVDTLSFYEKNFEHVIPPETLKQISEILEAK